MRRYLWVVDLAALGFAALAVAVAGIESPLSDIMHWSAGAWYRENSEAIWDLGPCLALVAVYFLLREILFEYPHINIGPDIFKKRPPE